MRIKIVADTSCDLPDELLTKYNIDLVPFRVNFENGETFLERFEIGSDEFAVKMSASKILPKTAAPDPASMIKIFEKGLSEAEEIMFFGLSSAMSSAIQNAYLARDMMNTNRITIYDGLSISLGTGILMIKAARMMELGLNIPEICRNLDSIRKKTEVFMMVDSLDNMIKGGRLNKYEGWAGNLLSVKPIVRVMEKGVPELFEKVRGQKKAIKRMADYPGLYAGSDASDRIIGICHLSNPENAKELAAMIRTRYNPKEDIITSNIGTTLGTHGGMGSLFLTF